MAEHQTPEVFGERWTGRPTPTGSRPSPAFSRCTVAGYRAARALPALV